ncbi:MAG: PorT family protein [Bacteroidales bacterium]|nr:PorT family protein [Bacteroidales bacterium]
MRNLITLALFLFIGTQLFAQEKDSSQVIIGKTKITVYNKEARELEALKKSQKEFAEKMRTLKDSITEIKIEFNLAKEENVRVQFEKNMDEFEKQIAAYKIGVEDLELEIEKILKLKELGELDELSELEELEELDEDFDFDFDETENERTTRRKRKFKGHWAGFEFGLNGFTNSDFEMELPSDGQFMELNTNKSWEFALNFIELNIPLFSRYTGLVTGLGVEWNGYEFKQNIKIAEDPTTGAIYGQDITDVSYEKNKLNVTYLKVPLILELQVPVNKKDRRIFIGAGATVSVKAMAKLKQVYDLNGSTQKDRAVNDYQINPLNYGLTARIGYRNLRLFANYSLTPLFETNQGPEVYPYSVGISVINF